MYVIIVGIIGILLTIAGAVKGLKKNDDRYVATMAGVAVVLTILSMIPQSYHDAAILRKQSAQSARERAAIVSKLDATGEWETIYIKPSESLMRQGTLQLLIIDQTNGIPKVELDFPETWPSAEK